jgi:hypothetical protein
MVLKTEKQKKQEEKQEGKQEDKKNRKTERQKNKKKRNFDCGFLSEGGYFGCGDKTKNKKKSEV